MRVLMVLLALVTTPFVMSVAQDDSRHAPKQKTEHGKARRSDAVRPHRDAATEECKEHPRGNAYGWEHGHDDESCDSPPPVAGSIQGTVFYDMSYDGVRDAGEPGIESWIVMLSGPVNATIVTDAAGNYSFADLPAGTYTVCESQRFGWIQTSPLTASSCTSGYGYTVVVPAGGTVASLDFGNVG